MLRDRQADSSSKPFIVRDTVTAEVLFRDDKQAALRPFMKEASTISEAARASGIKANTLYVWVQDFVELGLLDVVGEKPRAGRAQKLYKALHREFYIPYDVLSAETLEHALSLLNTVDDSELYHHIAKTLSRENERFGWLFVHTDDDELWFHAASYPGVRLNNLHPDRPAVINTGDTLHLNFDDAKAFQQELMALYKKYKTKAGAQAYLFRLSLVPKQE